MRGPISSRVEEWARELPPDSVCLSLEYTLLMPEHRGKGQWGGGGEGRRGGIEGRRGGGEEGRRGGGEEGRDRGIEGRRGAEAY